MYSKMISGVFWDHWTENPTEHSSLFFAAQDSVPALPERTHSRMASIGKVNDSSVVHFRPPILAPQPEPPIKNTPEICQNHMDEKPIAIRNPVT
jgi:hypothetical protein